MRQQKTYEVCGRLYPYVHGEAKSKVLTELEEQLETTDNRAKAGIVIFLDNARKCGEILIHAYNILGRRKKWSEWRRKHFNGSKETACLYKRIAEDWDQPHMVEARSKGIDTLRGLRKVLAEKRSKDQSSRIAGDGSEQGDSSVPELTQKEVEDQWTCKELRRQFAQAIKKLRRVEREIYNHDFHKIFEELVKPYLSKARQEWECEQQDQPNVTFAPRPRSKREKREARMSVFQTKST